MLNLEDRVKLGGRNYKVAAVLYIGERYYMLVRDKPGRDHDVALLPAVVVHRLVDNGDGR